MPLPVSYPRIDHANCVERPFLFRLALPTSPWSDEVLGIRLLELLALPRDGPRGEATVAFRGHHDSVLGGLGGCTQQHSIAGRAFVRSLPVLLSEGAGQAPTHDSVCRGLPAPVSVLPLCPSASRCPPCYDLQQTSMRNV